MKAHTLKQQAKIFAIVLHHAEQKAAGILLILIMSLALLYVYFLGSAVVHAVERKEVQKHMAQANSRIADLEVNYLQQKNDITSDMAIGLGFSHLAQKEYVERARYLGQATAQ